MAQNDCQNLFESIKDDNLTIFLSFVKNNNDVASISFGRFPILSVCYLFNAKKILRKFEKKFCKTNNFKVVNEPFAISKQFRLVCGRCLWLYLKNDSIVMPIEMLAILHKDRLVKIRFMSYQKTEKTNKNLQQIYLIYGQQCSIKNDKISISLRPLNKRQKNLFFNFFAVFGAFSVILSIFLTVLSQTVGLGTLNCPSKIYNISQLNYAISNNTNCSLQNDITIENEIDYEKYSGVFDGNNKNIFINYTIKNSLINNLSGTIKNINFKILDLDIEITDNFAFIANTNNGTIQNTNLDCKVSLNCKSKNTENFFACVAVKNNGYIKNCDIKLYGNFVGDGKCDFYASAIAGENNGVVSTCKTSVDSSLVAKNADISGIVAKNNLKGEVSSCLNYAKLVEETDLQSWSPNVAGISINNKGRLTNCINYENVSSTSNFKDETTNYFVFAGGICAVNNSTISHCLNYGNIDAIGEMASAYAGGISAYSTSIKVDDTIITSTISNCGEKSTIKILSKGEKTYAFGGGISGYFDGTMQNCFSMATFTTNSDQTKYYQGLCIGTTQVVGYNILGQMQIAMQWSELYALNRDNVSKCLGVLYNPYQTTKYDSIIDMADNWTLCSSEAQIVQSGVYWNEN